ncbi:MAG: aminoglycoside phosphotransferase [Proteobacteria bacterium]|nr:aminoglycoside phosphotransferase [Pseudomonadota bacterium]
MTDESQRSARTAIDPAALARIAARLPGAGRIGGEDLERLPTTGLAHDHLRLRGVAVGGLPVLLRVPRTSFWGLAPGAALARQAEAFRRLAPSSRTPRLLAVFEPEPDLPYGALAVEEVAGTAPDLPRDLPALAQALAAIHGLPVPPRAMRPPLDDQTRPVATTLAVIEAQADHVDAAGLHPDSCAMLAEDLAWARRFSAGAGAEAQPRALVLTDTQPGNFLIGANGSARCVDLEKALYGAVAIDLAHATIPPAVGWDPACAADLSSADILGFYRTYLGAAEPSLAKALRPWLAPMRRLTWLRTVTIFAKMKAAHLSGAWTGHDLAPDFLAHVLAHIDRCHDPVRIAAMRAEWTDGLDPLSAL